MDLSYTKIPPNALETYRNLWLVQKKLKELLSQYGNCLDTIRINPYNNDARMSILSLDKEISNVGKDQNLLMKEWLESSPQLSEKYSSNKSILLENFRDALIRQLWSNGVEQCTDEIEEDIVKILFLNQMNLIPGNLSEYLNKANKTNSKSIDIGNLQVSSAVERLCNLPFVDGLENADCNKTHSSEEKHVEQVFESEPRCTRSSKPSLKRSMQDDDIFTKVKSRRKMPLLLEKPNTCCSLCKKLIFINDEDTDDNTKLICCSNCNDKFYSIVTVTSHSSSNNEEPTSPSDISSQNDTS